MTLTRTVAIMAIILAGCGSEIRPIKNARPPVSTMLPREVWICNDDGTLCDAGTINDVPPGYDCFVQKDKQVACWPVDTPASVTSKGVPSKPKVTLLEHLTLGAASYAAMAALAGPDHRLQVALPATALMAAFKEGTDAHDHTDSRKAAARHALMIMLGAGAVAILYH